MHLFYVLVTRMILIRTYGHKLTLVWVISWPKGLINLSIRSIWNIMYELRAQQFTVHFIIYCSYLLNVMSALKKQRVIYFKFRKMIYCLLGLLNDHAHMMPK